MKNLNLLFALVATLSLSAQNFRYKGEIHGVGLLSSEEDLPFWLHANQRGRINPETNFSGWANASATFSLSEISFIQIGAGFLYHDGFNDGVKLDESYLQFQNDWLQIIGGRKQKKLLYNGLSATNENILWSLNARPLPGLQLRTAKPVTLFQNIGLRFDAELEEYWMANERHVKGARLHHKSFHFILNPTPKFNLRFGIQHFVQWAGTSPEHGKLPGGFKDYLRVLLGKGGGEEATEGDQLNTLGNHLGSYEIHLTTLVNGHEVQLLYNHLFEDGSGSRFRNTPDGRYGLFFTNKDETKLINAVMYEFFYTKNQSKNSSTTDGSDNYFQHQLYASDWTYGGNILGVPFILWDRDDQMIIHNRILVHHLGISGNIKGINNLPFKLLTSYRKMYGAKGVTNYKYDVFSTNLDLLLYQNLFNLRLRLASDFISDGSPVFGAGVHISKEIF